MKDQRVSTTLGTIILIIIATTVAGFVLICFKNYPVTSEVSQIVTPKKFQKKSNEDEKQQSVSIVKKGDFNFVIYTDEEGQEIIIDDNLHSSKQFINAHLSPKGRYVLYSDKSWQQENAEFYHIYDITTKKNVEGISGMNVYFTPNEGYVYFCGPNTTWMEGAVYSVPEFDNIYNVHGKIVGEERVEFYNDYRVNSCNYDERKNSVRFVLENVSDHNDTKEVYFDLNTRKHVEND